MGVAQGVAGLVAECLGTRRGEGREPADCPSRACAIYQSALQNSSRRRELPSDFVPNKGCDPGTAEERGRSRRTGWSFCLEESILLFIIR